MADGVRRYRSKPEDRRGDTLAVARYEPGKPLDTLREVGQMACGGAEMAEVTLPSGTVLLVRWTAYPDDHPPRTQWKVVEAGGYLAYDCDDEFLFTIREAGLQQWYDEVPEERG